MQAVLFPVLLALLGCATGPSPQTPEGRARAVLNGLIRDFENDDPEGYLGRFDGDSISNFGEYAEEIRAILIHNHQFDIDIITDTVVEDNGRVSARTRWDRGFVDQNGARHKDSGACEFLFRESRSRGLLAIGIRGPSPFSATGPVTSAAPASEPAASSQSRPAATEPAVQVTPQTQSLPPLLKRPK